MTDSIAEKTSVTGLPSEGILVIEDDRAVQRVLKRLFESAGGSVQITGNAQEGLNAFERKRPGTVILDLRLPDMSGQDVCREIKKRAPLLPVIILSAVTDVVDKIVLLELGADDYVTKPFSPRELLARVRTHARIYQCSAGGPTAFGQFFTFGDVKVDFTKTELARAGQSIPLTVQEFKLLRFFIYNAERVISRDELLTEVWGWKDYLSTRTVDNRVLKLRQKLERDPASPVHFKTVHGIGYRFVP
jgi:two-component system alkaline phosphatase synthesis response regulator PhoP